MNMKSTLALVSLLLIPVTGQCKSFYVSPKGNDHWSGNMPESNRQHTDGPFATLQHALLVLAAYRLNHPALSQPVHIYLRGGFYSLQSTINVDPSDSGTPKSPTVIEAYHHEHPILSGGRTLAGWTKTADGRWHLLIPTVKSGQWNFEELWVNGNRRYRPRAPQSGYFHIASTKPATTPNIKFGYDQFGYSVGDINPDWQNLNEVELMITEIWNMAEMRIKTIHTASHVVTLTGPTWSTASWAEIPEGHQYLVKNVKENLNEPGLWYLDNGTGEVTYIPVHGEHRSKVHIVAPHLTRLLNIEGMPDKGETVRWVSFKGISFMNSAWLTPSKGYDFPQANADLGGTITMEGARHCLFQNCTISHTGAWGLTMEDGSRYNAVDDCAFTDLGAGGVKIGELVSRKGNLEAGHDTVDNCLMAAGGRIHPAATGILIGKSSYNTINRCTISDFYYTGISVGWTWGYAPSQAHNNIISNNLIERIGQGVLSDMGGIYLLGRSPGTIIEHNCIHDVYSETYGGWGVYLDEGVCNVIVKNNLEYNTKSGSLHQHYGEDNLIENNIFANSLHGQIIRTLAENHLSETLEHNIIYWNKGVLLGSNWSGNNYKFDDNLYWFAGGKQFLFNGMSFAEWQQKGQDVHSLIANPLFEDPSKNNFKLSSRSPALEIGFHPFPVHHFGCAGYSRLLKLANALPDAFPAHQFPSGS